MAEAVYNTAEVAVARRFSWGAIIAGTIIALVTWLTLSLLGLAIGLSTVNPASGGVPLTGLGIGAAIWWILIGIVSLFAGGWSAARLSGVFRRSDGAMNGILTFGLTSLIMVYFVTSSVGTIIGGAFGVLRTGVTAAGQAFSAVAPQIGMGNGSQGARSEAQQKGANVAAMLDRIAQSDTVSRADRDSLVNMLVAQANMSRPDAERTADRWINTYEQYRGQGGQQAQQQAQTQAAEIGEQAASAASRASLAAFFLMVLGAAAAAWGGAMGAPKEVRRSRPEELRRAA